MKIPELLCTNTYIIHPHKKKHNLKRINLLKYFQLFSFNKNQWRLYLRSLLTIKSKHDQSSYDSYHMAGNISKVINRTIKRKLQECKHSRKGESAAERLPSRQDRVELHSWDSQHKRSTRLGSSVFHHEEGRSSHGQASLWGLAAIYQLLERAFTSPWRAMSN